MSGFSDAASAIGGIAGGAIALSTLGAFAITRFKRIGKRMDEFMEDWHGSPARPGVASRPGVMERLSHQDVALGEIRDRVVAVEGEMRTNGGSSLRDAVNRIEGTIATLTDSIEATADRLDVIATQVDAVEQQQLRHHPPQLEGP